MMFVIRDNLWDMIFLYSEDILKSDQPSRIPECSGKDDIYWGHAVVVAMKVEAGNLRTPPDQ